MRFTEAFVKKYQEQQLQARSASTAKGNVLTSNTVSRKVRILGVDTSLRSTGLGVIDVDGVKLTHVASTNIPNPAKRSLPDCLKHIREVVNEYIMMYKPEEVAIEGVFYSRNLKTTLILGEARGVVICCCAEHNLPIYEYSPKRVKQAATGTGTAIKEQMQRMIAAQLALDFLPQEDAADALSIAMTHSHARIGITPGVKL
jgi:crossover junction endodeoxyribonuclease RuvC